MFSKIFENLQTFFITWAVIIVLNQVFIFGGCFAPYCLVAALPHTGIIAGLIVYFMNKEENKSQNTTDEHSFNNRNLVKRETPSSDTYKSEDTYSVSKLNENEFDDIEDIKEPFCPKCGSKMILRKAKTGKYAGSNFWGCSKFPECKSIINI